MKRVNNNRSFASPNKYIQGDGVFNEIKDYTDILGNFPLFIIDGFLFNDFKNKIVLMYHKMPLFYKREGEITEKSIALIEESVEMRDVNVVVAIGGGKTIDFGKVIANNHSFP